MEEIVWGDDGAHDPVCPMWSQDELVEMADRLAKAAQEDPHSPIVWRPQDLARTYRTLAALLHRVDWLSGRVKELGG